MAGQIPWDTDFVRALSGLTRTYGTLLLIDEVVTGFRDSTGGWQSAVGVTSDLTSLGKTIGGGLGAGALGGRADVMDVLNPRTTSGQSLRHSGTWNANPLTAAAGVAACTLYRGGGVQRKANLLAADLRRQSTVVLAERGIEGRLYGMSIAWLYFGPIDHEPDNDTLPPTRDVGKLLGSGPAHARLCLHLLQRGISTMGARFFILSAAHPEEDVERTVEAFAGSLDAMIAEGSLPTALGDF